MTKTFTQNVGFVKNMPQLCGGHAVTAFEAEDRTHVGEVDQREVFCRPMNYGGRAVLRDPEIVEDRTEGLIHHLWVFCYTDLLLS